MSTLPDNDNELHDDDQPIGRVLSRREVLALLGGAGAAFLLGGVGQLAQAQSPTITPTPLPIPTCVVKPELSAGPFFVDTTLNRSDIRRDPTTKRLKEGALLALTLRVSDFKQAACSPLAGAQVDIWHCDAEGVYSGVNDGQRDTTDQLWLRGYQITDDAGIAQFSTIYPGWYRGRAVHIHFSIRTQTGYAFTSQLFFDDAMSNDLFTSQAPYNQRGRLDMPTERDGLFRQVGQVMQMQVEPTEEGYAAVFDVALDLS
jgi:protocatechuate 3,4-dioxygenase beta subunit